MMKQSHKATNQKKKKIITGKKNKQAGRTKATSDKTVTLSKPAKQKIKDPNRYTKNEWTGMTKGNIKATTTK